MIADLKEKFAGIDRKRLYTAVGALMIAGVAGHFMQRSADVPASGPAPAAPSGIAATMTTVPGAAAPTPSGEAEPAASVAAIPEASVEPVENEEAVAEGPMPIDSVERAPDAALVENAAADATPVATPFITDPADIDVEMVATEPVDPALLAPEVTRGPTSPVLEVPEVDLTADAIVTTIPADATPVVEEAVPMQIAALDDAPDLTDAPIAPIPDLPGNACDISFEAEPRPGALVSLTLDAPCNSGEDVEFDHMGLRFSEQLGPDGDTIALVPAMAETAVFRVRFEDGLERAIEIDVPDFGEVERMAIVWKGATGLQLHALENGATYGEPGHVLAQQPGTADMVTQGAGGFVSVLGSAANGYAADVYTFPARLMREGVDPDVSIEAQVMENTCGTQIRGSILRTNPVGAPNIEELSMMVPGCDAVGEYLVLKNLPQDLKLTRN